MRIFRYIIACANIYIFLFPIKKPDQTNCRALLSNYINTTYLIFALLAGIKILFSGAKEAAAPYL